MSTTEHGDAVVRPLAGIGYERRPAQQVDNVGVMLATIVAAGVAAIAVVDVVDGRLLIAVVACLGTCGLLVIHETLRTRDMLNGATFLLVPVALGFGAQGVSLLVGGGHLRFPQWISTESRDALASPALWTATAGAAALYAGYRIGLTIGERPANPPARGVSPRKARVAILVLAIVGVVSFAVLLYELGGISYFERIAYAREETAGLGTLKLLAKGAPLAGFLWMATTDRLTAKRVLLVVAALLLMTTGQRSHVFATVIPALVIYHYRVKPVSLRAAAGIIAFCAVVTVGFVQYRQYTRAVALEQTEIGGAVIVGHNAPPTGSSSVFRTALVSLDGLVLVQRVYPARESPTWGKDLVRVVQGFVPRRIWPDKPPWLHAELSNRYLNFRTSGIFLSGFGYLWAVGLLPGVIAGSLLVGVGVGWLYGRLRATRDVFWLVLYGLTALSAARFELAGDAITFFFYLQMLVPALIVFWLISIRTSPSYKPIAVMPRPT